MIKVVELGFKQKSTLYLVIAKNGNICYTKFPYPKLCERRDYVFKIVPKVYSSMFSLPTEIADKGLKFASGDQLKVIIAIFRNPDNTEEQIAKLTNLSLETVNECVEYWVDCGVLMFDEAKNVVKTEKQVAKVETVKTTLPEIHFIKPTQAEIEKVLKKNGSMKRLFNEAQEILGRTFGFAMQSTIYSVVYSYNIKPDVANCLLHFAKSIDSTGHDDILKIAKYWAENGITTLSAADEYISETEKALSLFKELAKRTNNDDSAPSFAVLAMVSEWLRWGFNIDVIEKAFNIMKEEKKTGRLVWANMRHINGVLKKWRSADMLTVEDIEKGTKKFQTKQAKKNIVKETSFDIQKAEEKSKSNRKDFGEMKNKRKKGKGA